MQRSQRGLTQHALIRDCRRHAPLTTPFIQLLKQRWQHLCRHRFQGRQQRLAFVGIRFRVKDELTQRLGNQRQQIIGRHQNGWYEVRMDGHQGWLFGAFVNPPPTGHQIIQASSGNIVLRSSAGVPLGITNESGPKALATGSTGNLFRVILPNGETAYVSRNDVFVAIP